jgi:autotransporter-associated beta strand protein
MRRVQDKLHAVGNRVMEGGPGPVKKKPIGRAVRRFRRFLEILIAGGLLENIGIRSWSGVGQRNDRAVDRRRRIHHQQKLEMSMNQSLPSATRSLLTTAFFGCLATVASAAPPAVITYGTGSGETSTPYTGGTIAPGDTVRLNDGATVTGNITNNGTLDFNQTSGTLSVSNTLSGTGTLSLNGTGGTLQLTGTTGSGTGAYVPLNMTTNVYAGTLTGAMTGTTQKGVFRLGSSGTGTLNIAGGLVTGTSWQVGVGTGGVGTINVSSGTFGPRGGITIGGITGGTGGTGTLNITGGLVGDTAFIASSLANTSRIAAAAGSTGLVTITGGTFGSNSQVYIGDVGNGTMTLNSGYLKTGETILGSGAAANGTLNLLGGTALGMSTVVVGGTGTGTLTVNGALYQTRNSTIGESAGSNGTVTVTSGTWLNNASGIGNEIQGYLAVGGSGTGSLTINDGGYVSVSGTFSRGANGTFTLNKGGTLQIGSANGNTTPYTTASGTSGVLVGDLNYAGTLKFAQNSNGVGGSVISTHAGNLSGTGDLVKTGTGTLNLTGSNSYTGGTTIEQGRISLANANSIGTTGTISFSTSGTVAPGALQATANNTADYSSRFSNAANQRYAVDSNGETLTLASNLTSSGGSFTKYGTGTVSLTGANTFTSGSVAAGTLMVTVGNLATTGTFNVASGGELRFNQASSGTWQGAMAGSGTFAKVGAGALTLTGSTSNTNGTLLVSEGSVIGNTNSIRRAVTNNAQVTFNQSVSGTYSSVLSGTGVLVKEGVGTLSLTGSNTSTGDWTLDDGTLSLGNANALGSGGAINFDGGTLQSTANNTADYSARFSNAANQEYRIDSNGQSVTLASALTSSGGSFTKVGSGTATLTGANSYSGGTTVSAGRLAGNATSLQGNIVNNANVAFTQSSGSGTYSGLMSGNGSLTKLGSGTLTLTGSNSYSGGTTITSGRLIGTTSTIRGAINNAAAVTFDQSTSGTYSSNITGAGPGGSLTKSGSGVVTLSGSNTYTQGTTLTDGTLALGSANAIGASGTITFNGGTLQSTASNTTDYSARFSNAADQQYRIDTNGRDVTLASNLTSSGGSFTKLGTGTTTLSGTNSYSGGTTVSAGSLVGTTSSLQGAVTNNAAVTLDQSTDGSYAGAMSGSGSLSKLGTGSVTLTGNSTYTGSTTVSGGSLVVNGSLANTALTVQTGASLGGSGSIGSGGGTTVSIESGGSLSPGNSPGMLTINGSLILSEGSTFNYEMVGGGVLADSIDVNGALNLGNASLNLTNLGNYTVNQKFTMFAYETMVGSFAGLANNAVFSGAGGTWKINYNDTSGGVNAGAAGASYVTLTAVSSIPEPRSVLVGGLLLAGLFLRQRRAKGF